MPVRAVCKPHSPDLKRGALATDARGCSLWRSLLERPPPAPESRVRDPLGELVRTRVGGVTAAHVTHLSTRTHTYRNIWTTANQRGGPPFTISDWFRPRYKPNGGVFCWTTEFLSRGYFFFSFLEWLDAPVRPGIFVSRTRGKLGRTCDQTGRTLEPWFVKRVTWEGSLNYIAQLYGWMACEVPHF